MSWIPLKSSNLDAMRVEWAGTEEPTNGDLFVRFKVGTVYRITDVPGEIITGLRDAESPGGFFAREIKGRFTTEKQPA